MAAIFGGVLMMIADVVARSIATSEIPLLVLTGIFGSVAFLIILRIRGGRVDERL